MLLSDIFFSKRRFLTSSFSSFYLSEVHFFQHFIQKSLYTAFEMRYTALATGGVQSFLHSIARGSGYLRAVLVVINNNKHIENITQ